MKDIQSTLREKRSFSPKESIKKNANLKDYDLEQYAKILSSDPNKFWGSLARDLLDWDHPFDSVCYNESPFFKWFKNGKINVTKNCVDRHTNKNKTAIIHISEDNKKTEISYDELFDEINKFAYTLRGLGLDTGDRVIIYMPTIPQSIIAMLSCARIGLVHSVVFAGFSSESLKERVIDCKAKLVITVDAFKRGGKLIHTKKLVDDAIQMNCEFVENVIIFNNEKVDFKKTGRDLIWQDIIPKKSVFVQPESLDSEALLFILYTSGSTGKPKGIMHTSAGYLLNCILTNKWVFDLKDEDLFWCTADIGWITGHSYVVYGPLASGSKILIYDGSPTFPNANRFWEIIQNNNVSIFYTAPTAIRMLMKVGENSPTDFKLTSLRILGTVGEPINPKAWMWYYRMIGNEKCPIVDTWWQTETGANMIAPLPGISKLIPGSCTKPLPGIDAAIIDNTGKEINVPNYGGDLVIKKPWPSMLRGIWGDQKRYIETYWSKYSLRYYLTGDTARYDSNGNIWIMGRSDDVVNVSGHRLGTMEIESALVSHESVAEAAVVSYSHDIKGEAIHAFVSLKNTTEEINNEKFAEILRDWVKDKIGSIAKPERISFSDSLPKTRSGKIMRRLLRSLAREEDISGDISTLENEGVIGQLKKIL
tara:strand:+ start:18021 stop:19964 length:1944 start_codon:yes stop_codon:yes gene_type:complete